MTTCDITIDQIESNFAVHEKDGSLFWGHEFYAQAQQLFQDTDIRIIKAVTSAVLGDPAVQDVSQVRRVIYALENGFVNEGYFLRTFNELYPATDVTDKVKWENTSLVVQDTDHGPYWCFE